MSISEVRSVLGVVQTLAVNGGELSGHSTSVLDILGGVAQQLVKEASTHAGATTRGALLRAALDDVHNARGLILEASNGTGWGWGDTASLVRHDAKHALGHLAGL